MKTRKRTRRRRRFCTAAEFERFKAIRSSGSNPRPVAKLPQSGQTIRDGGPRSVSDAEMNMVYGSILGSPQRRVVRSDTRLHKTGAYKKSCEITLTNSPTTTRRAHRLSSFFVLNKRRFEMTIAAALTERLFSRNKEREQAAARSQEQVIAAFADGTLTNEDEILDALEQAGMTVEQLQDGVRALEERNRLKALIAEQPAVQAEFDKVNARLERLQKERDEAVSRFKAAAKETEPLINEHRSKLHQIEEAKRRMRGLLDFDATESITSIDSELESLNWQIEAARIRIDPHHPKSLVKELSQINASIRYVHSRGRFGLNESDRKDLERWKREKPGKEEEFETGKKEYGRLLKEREKLLAKHKKTMAKAMAQSCNLMQRQPRRASAKRRT